VSDPAVSAIAINYEGGDSLLACLRSLAEQDVSLDVLIVDNGSSDGSAERACAAFPDVRLVRPHENLGFAGAANLGASHAGAPLLLFLNPDVTLTPGCLAALLRALEEPRSGVVGPATDVSASGQREYGATIDPLGYPVPLLGPGAPLYVPGCALATRADVFRELGGFDDRFFMFAEDVDYCWRALLAGWNVAVVPEALALHVGGASAPGGYLAEDGLRTTRFRVALRERNTLAMLLKCHGPAAAAVSALAYPVQALGTAAALALTGNRATAREIVGGLAWNARELRETLARRKAARRGNGLSDRAVAARMHRGLRKLELLRRFGLPRIDDVPPVRPAPP
jgi:GT2 family glycosyltransferase